MTIKEAIYAYLVAQTGLTALTGRRLYPVNLPQNTTFPSALWILINANRNHLMGNDASLIDALYRFQIYGKTFDSAKAVALQIKTALQDYSGTMGGESGVVVQRVFFESADEDYNDEDQIHMISQEYKFWYIK